jgi:cell division transport system permease protein
VSRFDFVLREVFRSVCRHGLMTVASVSTSAAALTVLGFVYVGAQAVNQLSARVLDKFEAAAFTSKSVTANQLLRLRSEIQSMPEVKSVTVVTRDEAWERQKRNYSHIPYLSKMKNPLTDEIWVRVKQPEQIEIVAKRLRSLPGIESVSVPSGVLDRAIRVARLIRTVGIVMCAALMGATSLITSNSIRLSVFARRREIRIMQLVGATDGFIKMPFILEGALHGLLGAAVACILLGFGLNQTFAAVRQTAPFLQLPVSSLSLTNVYLGLVVVGAGVGASASAVSVGRFLRA